MINWLKNIFKTAPSARLEGAAFSSRRTHLAHGYRSARFDASNAERVAIVKKARWFEYNSHVANRLADIFETYTVGSGINVSPASGDANFNAAAAESWRVFSRAPCVNSRMSFAQLQSLCARRWFFDGEVFILLTRDPDGAPRVQLVETHHVETPRSRAGDEGKSVITGVVVDQRAGGRPVGYHIGRDGEGGAVVHGEPVPADFVVHIHEPWRANEYRGLPFFTPIVNLLHDLDDLHMFEMMAAKDAAHTTLVIKTATGEVKPTFLRAQKIGVQKPLADGGAAQATAVQYYEDVLDGRAKILRHGDSIEQLNSGRPSVVTQQFWRMTLEHICNGVGIPYVLAFPESLQGTTYRGTLAMAASVFRSRYSVLAEAWSRVYEHHIRWAVANDPLLRGIAAPRDYRAHSMRPPRSPDVDAGRTSRSMLAELAVGATNYDQIFSPQGLDWREEFRKLREQQEYAKNIGLDLGGENKTTEDA